MASLGLGGRRRKESLGRTYGPRPRESWFSLRRDLNGGHHSFATRPLETRGGRPLLTQAGSTQRGNPQWISSLLFGQVPQTCLTQGAPGNPWGALGGIPWSPGSRGAIGSPWELPGSPLGAPESFQNKSKVQNAFLIFDCIFDFPLKVKNQKCIFDF